MNINVNSFDNSVLNDGEQHYLTSKNTHYNRFYSSAEQRNKIGELINEAISIYIDQSYQLTTTQLIFKTSEKKMITQMEGPVNQSLELVNIKQHFNGFSIVVEKTLHDITTINWGIEKYLLLGDDEIERDLTLTTFIDQEFMRLKIACHAEVSVFIEEKNIEISPNAWNEKKEELIRVSDVEYHSEDFISPLEYTLEWPIAAAAYELDIAFPKSFIEGYNKYSKSNKKQKKRKRDYTEELITVIKQNSEQLISLQKDLKSYNEAGIARDREQNYTIQAQIGELQNQINELDNRVSTQNKPSNKITYNSRDFAFEKTTVTFDVNSTKINNAGKILLNKVFDTLIKMPKDKVIITGYADKTGNTDYNIYLSRKRAQEVKNYLLYKGIKKNRLFVNYMGDVYSNSKNSSDRKVEIEFINKSSSIDFTLN